MNSEKKTSVKDNLVQILAIHDQIMAEMVKSAIENEAIPVLLKSVAGYHSRGMLPFKQSFFDYRLYVEADNEHRARELVETIIPAEELQ